MRGFRFLGFGMALGLAVALIAFASPSYAKGLDGMRASGPISCHDFSIPDIKAMLAVPAYQTDGYAVGVSPGAGQPLINHTHSPARFGAAILATSKAGWGSGRLRKLAG